LIAIGLKGGVLIGLVGVLIMVFRNSIWDFFYGKEQIEYSYILFWFAPILLFNFLGFPYRFAIRTINQTRILFEAYILSSLFGFATAHLLIMEFDIHGICLGLLLTQIIMQLWYIYRLNKFIKCASFI
jgi:O-antigen/teichoic acid export membrane protein